MQKRLVNFSVLEIQWGFWHYQSSVWFDCRAKMSSPCGQNPHGNTQTTLICICMHTLTHLCTHPKYISAHPATPIYCFYFKETSLASFHLSFHVVKYHRWYSASIKKNDFPLVLEHFCLGKSPPRGTVICMWPVGKSHLGGTVKDLQAQGEILKGAGPWSFPGLPSLSLTVECISKVSRSILQSPCRERDY